MCTAATYCSGDFYFGRNLDYEFSYGEHVTIMPRNTRSACTAARSTGIMP